ncbi:MAG: Gfo/Idh/MocA family oxidoreductase [Acidimicrobiales bacterium]
MSTDTPLRLAVIGAGIMGANHARVAASLPQFEVAYVVDPDPERAGRVAGAIGASPLADPAALGDIDAAVVAVPTPFHAAIATPLVERGVAVLVEKPMAASVAEAEALAAAAERSGATLMVGHVERFNPAVLELPNLLGEVIHITANRISPFSPRITDNVVLDLMIHDLDVVASLVGRPVLDVKAVAQTVRTGTEDLVTALLSFEGGATAVVTASRIGQQKIRELTVTHHDNVVTVDLIRQAVTINRVDHVEYVSDSGPRYRQTGVVEIPFLEHRGEPLALELTEFASAITQRRPARVGAADGVRAVALVERVLQAVRGD